MATPSPHPGVLSGLRVLDLTWGVAGPMATMLLADHGALVTRIERPGGEPFGDFGGGRVWNRGKRSAVLDLHDAADRDVLMALAEESDVVIESFAPGVADRLGIGWERLHAANPRLILCSITGYGRGTRHRDRPGIDALVAARTGLQWETRGWYGSPMSHIRGTDAASAPPVPASVRNGSDREGPIFTATPAPSVATAYLATLGISAALCERERSGRGQWVETSLLQAILVTLGSSWQRAEHPEAPGYDPQILDRRQPWGIVRAADGWVCTWTTRPDWLATAGAGHELVAPVADATARRRGVLPVEELAAALGSVAPVVAKFPVAAWVRLAADAGDIAIQPVRTPEDALCDPALLAEDAVVEVDDPELGPLRQAGILYRLHGRPAAVRGPAPRRGEHTEQVRAEARARRARAAGVRSPAVPTASTGDGPLAGVRVVDFGLAVAGPWASQMLADLGADVIKVDPERQAFWFPNHMSLAVNRSKRSVVLDMKSADGLRVAHELIRWADVVTLNMRPEAAGRLGLDYESLHRLNPTAVVCHSRGFEDGPRSALPGNDQTANALAGTEWEDGGCWNGGRPWFGLTSLGDKGNGYLSAIAVVQALYDRARTGRGQKVDASIINGALFNNSRVFTTPSGTCFERPKLDADQLGFSALYRLYSCREGWLCLAVVADGHWEALAEACPALAADPRFATAAQRRSNDAALASAIGTELSGLTAADAFELLDGAGVPCEVSDDRFATHVFDDEELIGRGWVTRCDGNPQVGSIDMFGVGIDFSETPARAGGPPPVLGQHTRQVLAEFGYDEPTIDGFIATGAAGTAAERS